MHYGPPKLSGSIFLVVPIYSMLLNQITSHLFSLLSCLKMDFGISILHLLPVCFQVAAVYITSFFLEGFDKLSKVFMFPEQILDESVC